MNYTSWHQKIKSSVADQKENIKLSSSISFITDRFVRIAKRTDEFAADCDICENHKETIEEKANSLAEIINGSYDDMKNFEDQVENIFKHMKSEHSILPERYYTSFYSLIGMIAGTILFTLIFWILDLYLGVGLISGWIIGLIAGRITGYMLDLRQKKLNKQL